MAKRTVREKSLDSQIDDIRVKHAIRKLPASRLNRKMMQVRGRVLKSAFEAQDNRDYDDKTRKLNSVYKSFSNAEQNAATRRVEKDRKKRKKK